MNLLAQLYLVWVVGSKVSQPYQHTSLGHSHVLSPTLVKIPDKAFRIGHEVLTAVTHGINNLGPLEQLSKTGPLGHTCKDYIRKCVHYGADTVCLTLPNGFVEGWHQGPEGLMIHEPFYINDGPRHV